MRFMIRLYPIAQESTLETLAGVSAGTAAKFSAFDSEMSEVSDETLKARAQLTDEEWTHYGRWIGIQRLREQQPDLEVFDNFLQFGWGRFQGLGLISTFLGSCGRTTNPILMRFLLVMQGISLPLGVKLEGVLWE